MVRRWITAEALMPATVKGAVQVRHGGSVHCALGGAPALSQAEVAIGIAGGAVAGGAFGLDVPDEPALAFGTQVVAHGAEGGNRTGDDDRAAIGRNDADDEFVRRLFRSGVAVPMAANRQKPSGIRDAAAE